MGVLCQTSSKSSRIAKAISGWRQAKDLNDSLMSKPLLIPRVTGSLVTTSALSQPVARDGSGSGTSGGLACLKNGTIQHISLGSEEEPAPSKEVTSLYEDPHGVLWFGTRDGALHRLQNGHDQRVAALNREGG